MLSDLNKPWMGEHALFEHICKPWPALPDRFGFVTSDMMSPEAEAFLAAADRPSL